MHASITAAGHEERTSTDYDWHGLKRGSAEFCLFQYTLTGRGQLAWEGQRYTVEAGQAMLLWFPHDNRYWLGRGDRWHHLYLCLAGSEVMRAWRTLVARHGPLVTLPRTSAAPETAAAACLACLRGEVRDTWTSSALAYSVAMSLCSDLLGEPQREAAPPAIVAAKRFGSEHAAAGIGVSDLARAAGMSRHHFARVFAHCEGLTPSQWLIDLRMREATRLLRNGTQSVAEIGAACGFADPAYFCRAFRRQIGLSPGEFRSSGMY